MAPTTSSHSVPAIRVSTAPEEFHTQMYTMAPNADSSNFQSMQHMQHIPSIHIEETQEAFQSHNYMYEMLSFPSQSATDKSTYSDGSQGLFSPLAALSSQPNTFELDDLSIELGYLATEPFLSGPHPGLGDGTLRPESGQFLPSTPPSPSSPYNGSQSPASQFSDFALSDAECGSPLSPATPDDYMISPASTGPIRHRGPYPFLGHRHTSSESIATKELLPPSTLGHHRSQSMSSVPRARVATQAMLEANERRRRHQPQFQCSECGQEFTAQFSLK
ncbi:hypothetical protein ID866_6325, partial [Astraeus odoratus]